MAIFSTDEKDLEQAAESIGLGNAGPASGAAVNTINSLFKDTGVDGNVTSLGFTGLGLNLMSSVAGSELGLNLSKEIVNIYTHLPEANRPRVVLIDREVVGNIAYSVIVVSKVVSNTVYYYTILLEVTGRQAATATELMEEWNTEVKQNKYSIPFTPDAAVDNILHEVIINSLGNSLGYTVIIDNNTGSITSVLNSKKEEISFTHLDGLVVYNVPEDIKQTAALLAAIANNAVSVNSALITKRITNLRIPDAVASTNNRTLAIKKHGVTQGINALGDPVRTDFSLSLVLEAKKSNKETSLNFKNADESIAKVGGFIETIAEEVDMQVMTNYGPSAVKKTTLRPNIILTSTSLAVPTYGHMLLGLITGIIMVRKDMWLPVLTPKEEDNQVGALNVITALGANPGEQGQLVNLKSGEYAPNEVYAFIQGMYTKDPILSMDIDTFGPETYYTSILTQAAAPVTDTNRVPALQELVKLLNYVTGGKFPLEYNIEDIFVAPGTTIPTGVWVSKDGLKDIREIDAKFVANKTQDFNLLRSWILSNVPSAVNNADPYLTKLNVISKIIPNAVIRGKAIRVTFTGNFINTLTTAVTQAGLNINITPEYVIQDVNVGYNMVGDILGNAGIRDTNIGGIFRATNGNNNGYIQTPYGYYNNQIR